jgi:malonyl-CoA decarboxylase
MRYEAVHGMADWEDLRARLDPPDRQIYGFFHPRLGNEPLIFIEVALMAETPTNIQDILCVQRQRLHPSRATTAVFYSISNCQDGLRGIPLGSFLIKRVVEDLRSLYPQLVNFVTLSPVPGFSTWLEGWIDEKDDGSAREMKERLSQVLLLRPACHDDGTAAAKQEMRDPIAAAAGYFLVHVKGDGGLPKDAVARFHLGNGARLERINWPADTSPQGMAKSVGVMVNYLYDLDELERNHENLASSGKIATSSRVMRDIGKAPVFVKRARESVSEGN